MMNLRDSSSLIHIRRCHSFEGRRKRAARGVVSQHRLVFRFEDIVDPEDHDGGFDSGFDRVCLDAR